MTEPACFACKRRFSVSSLAALSSSSTAAPQSTIAHDSPSSILPPIQEQQQYDESTGQKKEQEKKKTSRIPQQLPYNWKHHWYPVTFFSYLPPIEETVATSVFGQRLVLWRTKDNPNKVYCADDRCPHRAAALSVGGRVLDNGALECMYHGWQFNSTNQGKPNCIPQLPTQAKLPTSPNACLRMRPASVVDGVVWVWMDDDNTPPSPTNPPITDHGDRSQKRLNFFDYQCDFAVDHSFILENLIDPAHIPHSHAESFGDVNDAQPLEMQLTQPLSSKGFSGRFRRTLTCHSAESKLRRLRFNKNKHEIIKAAEEQQQQTSNGEDKEFPWDTYEFCAPNSLYMTTHEGKNAKGLEKLGLLTFHVTPMSAGRSRLLFRLSFANPSRIIQCISRLIPKWLSSLSNSKSLEEDLSFIISQQEWFASQHHQQQQQQQSSTTTSSTTVLNQGTVDETSKKEEAAVATTLEQVQQQQQPQPQPRMLSDDYTPLKSADVFVVAYRQWLDAVGHGMPWFWGYTSRHFHMHPTTTTTTHTNDLHTATSTSTSLSTPTTIMTASAEPMDPFAYPSTTLTTPNTASVTRYNSHVIYNPVTRGALQKIRNIKKGLVGVAVGVASIGFASMGLSGRNKLLFKSVAVLLPLSSVGAYLMHVLEEKFYTSFTRKKSQRGF